jgi:hypothetical protein
MSASRQPGAITAVIFLVFCTIAVLIMGAVTVPARAGADRALAMSKRPRTTETRPAMLSVYDGTTCVGFLLSRGPRGVEAYDADNVSLGVFATEKDASDAISARLEQAAKPRKQGRRR